ESSFMDALSNAFRANADSILMTMETLGLTMDDLSDQSNLTALANAMNEGAANLGVPQIEDIDATVESLMNKSNDTESTATTGTAGGGGGGESDEETTTKIVTINGVQYLEITTTENGVTTTTRTVLTAANASI
ncbi:MAG: hypothetical protein K6F37_04510, partial [Lachnospiraceae bacterium]|nr:hypothetical protein [Lachnospiraceae bacterium]